MRRVIPSVCSLSSFLLFLHVSSIKGNDLDEQLGRSVKITPTVEDAYVFKENWLPGFEVASSGTATTTSA
jgi:hypothetical protein